MAVVGLTTAHGEAELRRAGATWTAPDFTGLAWAATPYLHGRWRAAPWIAVALVALARIYLGAHNPLDVVGGLGLGLAIGGAVNLILGVPEAGTARPRPQLSTP